MKRLLMFVFIGLGMVGTLAAAGGRQGAAVQQPQEIPASRVFVDAMDREIFIPAYPERVLAFNGSVLEMIFNVGAIPVGRVQEFQIDRGVTLPSVGTTNQINIEAVAALNPDLIIANIRTHSHLRESLEALGAPLYFMNPDGGGASAQNEITLTIGEMLGRRDAAEEYLRRLYEISDAYKEQIVAMNIRNAIIIRDGQSITAAQPASGYGIILTDMLGVPNVITSEMVGGRAVSFLEYNIEAFIRDDPEIIMILSSSNDQAYNDIVLRDFKADTRWAGLYAVRNNNVVVMPFRVNPNRAPRENMVRYIAQAILSTRS